MSALFIIGTPIGNLGDITQRLKDTLKNCDYILAEDTRVASKILAHLQFSKPLISFNEHATHTQFEKIFSLLKDGKKLAFLTDAGSPGISDPGSMLVREVAKRLPDISIIPIPGASAVTCALSISGFNADRFAFLGFPPHKKRRAQFFKHVIELSKSMTIVFFESPHRVKKTIFELKAVLGGAYNIVVARELTKKFETIYRSSLKDLDVDTLPEKGEYTIILETGN